MSDLKRDLLEPQRFQYLSVEDSKLYESVLHSADPKDLAVKRLLEVQAQQSRDAHCASRY